MIAAAPAPIVAPSSAIAGPIAKMRGTWRVVLLSAPDGRDASLLAQRADLDRAAAGLAERDIRVVVVAGGAVSGATDRADGLRDRYRLPPGRFAFVLIGKDGHVADREAGVVPAQALFERIDAMPMRRAEMRARRR